MEKVRIGLVSLGCPKNLVDSADPRRLIEEVNENFPSSKDILLVGHEPYFSEVLMLVNLVFRLVPRPLTTAMIASEMPAAIRPYSMAVAPDSSFQNFKIERFM